MHPKDANEMANNVDPELLLRSSQSGVYTAQTHLPENLITEHYFNCSLQCSLLFTILLLLN